MTKTILITGGAGFIGVNFVYYILEKYVNYKIVIIDKLTYAGNFDNLSNAFKNYKNRIIFYKEDIINKDKILNIFKKENPNYVVHFAAESHVDKSIENPYQFLMTNIIGTASLLEASHKIGIDRFHFVSTDEVFGELDINNLNNKFTENSNYNPRNPYSASKAGADHLVRAYLYTYGMDITISNCTNNIGPYQYPEKIVPFFVLRLIHNDFITIHGDGTNMRDYINVKDHCIGIDLVLHKGKKGETYFFSTEKETSNLDIAKMIIKIMGKSENKIKYIKDRPGNDMRYAMYYKKSKKELGWEPKYTLKESLKETVNWYIRNENWYKNIWK